MTVAASSATCRRRSNTRSVTRSSDAAFADTCRVWTWRPAPRRSRAAAPRATVAPSRAGRRARAARPRARAASGRAAKPRRRCAGPRRAGWRLSPALALPAGRQFDRTAAFYLGHANIYYGTTAEPRATLSPSWHVERDVTDLTPIFESAETGEANIGNFVGVSGGVTYNG